MVFSLFLNMGHCDFIMAIKRLRNAREDWALNKSYSHDTQNHFMTPTKEQITSMLSEAHQRLTEANIGGVLLTHSIAISKENHAAAEAILIECGLPAHITQQPSNEIIYIKATL